MFARRTFQEICRTASLAMIWMFWATAAASEAAPDLVAAENDNLLANPGFETVVVDQPARWDLFVQPMAGAFGRLSAEAFEGSWAVMLHTPTPYESEPCNNWSQNVIEDLAGTHLRASARIRTEDATEAALWVQCWRKRPWGVLKMVSSSQASPVYGTRAWEAVEFSLEVPEGTDFVTVRCVLKGTGTVWFDQICLNSVAEEEKEGQTGKQAKEKEGQTDATEVKPPLKPEVDDTAPTQDTAPMLEAMGLLESELRRLREANMVLAGALDGVRDNNVRMMEEMMLLRERIRSMQSDDATMENDDSRTGAPGP